MDFPTGFILHGKLVKFCPNTTFTFLEKSKLKVESLLYMHRNTCYAWYEVCWPEKFVSCVLALGLAIQMASNCWLPACERSYSAWIGVYHGGGAWLFCPCERTVARESVHTWCMLGSHLQT